MPALYRSSFMAEALFKPFSDGALNMYAMLGRLVILAPSLLIQ
jgi:hypothetical protein